ncbi:hypothetical protein DF186_23275, partial [Enterococcus hirae]
EIGSIGEEHGFYVAGFNEIESEPVSDSDVEPLVRSLMSQFEQYVKLSKKIPVEILTSVSSIEEPSRLVDTIAAHMSMKI